MSSVAVSISIQGSVKIGHPEDHVKKSMKSFEVRSRSNGQVKQEGSTIGMSKRQLPRRLTARSEQVKNLISSVTTPSSVQDVVKVVESRR